LEPTIFNTGIRDVTFGKNVKVANPVNLYECTINDNCFIGPFVEIQKGVTIGEDTRVQSHSFICELVIIGKSCFIGHGVMFINDLFSEGAPAAGNKDLWKETRIGDRVYIGSNATILPVTICDNVVIGAGAVVTKDINKPGVYVGNPAKFLKTHHGGFATQISE
jgi:acetyltransferase-like isoleucine patch superfamily enzyme